MLAVLSKANCEIVETDKQNMQTSLPHQSDSHLQVVNSVHGPLQVAVVTNQFARRKSELIYFQINQVSSSNSHGPHLTIIQVWAAPSDHAQQATKVPSLQILENGICRSSRADPLIQEYMEDHLVHRNVKAWSLLVLKAY